ncbi:MAG: M48 family metallopeptidase [Gammaproteobacteria bacterium]|jgi:predicted Zn-dependent protease
MKNKINKYLSILLASIFFIILLTGCATSPTGQSQLKIVPTSEINRMGVTAFEDIKRNTPINRNREVNAYVRCVADAIIREIPGNTRWEIVVFEDEAVNAFALPGGKIGVYTGLLNVADGQDQLASVIGHEVAHVSADHGNARISASYATQSGFQLVQAMAGVVTPQKAQLLGLLGVGLQAGILLPYGRGQESEADILGLNYMANAGFVPGASILLWENMSKQNKEQPPEFLSTHPSHQTRINDLKAAMPNAQGLFNQAMSQGKRPNC